MALERGFTLLDAAAFRYCNYQIQKVVKSDLNQLEIGSGNGEFLLNMAEKFKDQTFFGIEYKKKYIEKTLQKTIKKGLDNVRLLCSEAETAISFVFPEKFFDTIHINFPDPWPKKRHTSRRVVNEIFVKKISTILKDDGKVFIASDVEEYFLNIVSLLKKNGFIEMCWEKHTSSERPYKTKYEKAFLFKNKKIFYSLLKKS